MPQPPSISPSKSPDPFSGLFLLDTRLEYRSIGIHIGSAYFFFGCGCCCCCATWWRGSGV